MPALDEGVKVVAFENGNWRSGGHVNEKRSVLSRLYPERRIASFTRHEGRFLFYSLVADLLRSDSVVLDFGAGRGAQIEHSTGYLRRLIDFSGRCKRYIAADVDRAVLDNPYVDERHIIGADGSIPLADRSVDMVLAYAVLEHVEDPRRTSEEIRRVLRPGGWFCAWTPNKYGYVGLCARLIPNRFHAAIVRTSEPKGSRQEHDVFPVYYRMNTHSVIRAVFGEEHFEDYSFYDNGSPTYHFNKMFVARFWRFVMTVSPTAMAKSLFVFVKKRGEGTDLRSGGAPS
jgi:SAM-dependent methyltransferase